MNDRNVVIEFTRGMLDRIREHCRQNFPEEWKPVDEAPSKAEAEMQMRQGQKTKPRRK